MMRVAAVNERLFRFGPDDFARVRDVMRDAGYTDAGVVAVVGEGLGRLGARKIPPFLRRTSGGSRIETLIRLFIAGVAVTPDAAAAAVAPMTVGGWIDL